MLVSSSVKCASENNQSQRIVRDKYNVGRITDCHCRGFVPCEAMCTERALGEAKYGHDYWGTMNAMKSGKSCYRVHVFEISPFALKHTDDMYHPDLGRTSDWLKQISGTTNQKHIWLVTRHQYGISALVFQTSFLGETRGGVSKCEGYAFPASL